MEKTKRAAALLLCGVILLLCAACQKEEPVSLVPVFCSNDEYISAAKLSIDHKAEYGFTFADESEVDAAFTEGRADIAVCSLGEALKLCTADPGAKIACVSARKKYYVAADKNSNIKSLADLKGKTVFVSAGDAEKITSYILRQNSVEGVKLVSPEKPGEQAVVDEAAKNGGICVLSSFGAGMLSEKNTGAAIAVDLTEEWNKICNTGSTPVTCCVVIGKKLVSEQPSLINSFRMQFQVSVNYLTASGSALAAEDLVENGYFTSKEAASNSLSRCGLKYVDGEEMQFAVAATLEALGENGAYCGTAIPKHNIFY